MSWSSGKDSAHALARARSSGVDVRALLVTFNESADRVAMHAVRRALVAAQAQRLGLPLVTVELPDPCPNEVYEDRMAAAVAAAAADGIAVFVFGDLFLEDVRAYREVALAPSGIGARFPLWGLPTTELAREIVEAGVRAIVTCVDPAHLDPAFVGRAYDESFLSDLPDAVDPCGERGEFHTFVWDAPGFTAPIHVRMGGVVERGGFVFADVVPA